MRGTQGGVRRRGPQSAIVAALLGTVCFLLTGICSAVASDDGDDGFVIASDADVERVHDTLVAKQEPANSGLARPVKFVEEEEIEIPAPPSDEADAEYEMSPAQDPGLQPIDSMPHEREVSSDSVSTEFGVSDCSAEGCDASPATFAGHGCPSCGACEPCACGPPGRFWVRTEYLRWWTKGMHTPPLVTTSPLGTIREDAGVLGEPGTRVLFGGNDLLDDDRSGGRIRWGMWMDCSNTYGIEGEFLALEDQHEHFLGRSFGGVPILARPFYNPLIYAQDAELVGYPGLIEGDVGVHAESSLTSAGLRLRCNLHCSERACAPPCNLPDCKFCYAPRGTSRLDFLLGYRFMRLDESLFIFEDLNAFPVYNRFEIVDLFDAETEFHGVELGFLYEYHRCRWSVELLAKIALGNNHHEVLIDGGTRITANSISDTFPGGLLAQRTNMGHFESDKFGVIPEVGVTLGYRVTDCLKVTLGYSFIYWSKVVRPGEQIDRVVNPELFPPEANPMFGPLRPAFAFNDSDYWAQGLNAGLELRW